MSLDPFTIEDHETHPISGEHRALCGALDRLLTIGSYYQPSHERFQTVARECAAALDKSLDGRKSLELYITAKGLVIGDGLLPASEAEARRLFDLLDPLQIALVEIDAKATSDHLHLALASLKKARNSISATQSFREIEIKGLPETINVVNRTLFLRTKAIRQGRKKKEPAAEITFFDHNLISDFLLSGSDLGQKCEKEFIGIIQGIMATVDPTQLKNQETGGGGSSDDWLPDETIDAIKKVLEALAGTSSDLMNLQHLIQQAQTALEVTGDPELVDLIFSRLQKDSKKLVRKLVQPKMIGKGQRGTRTESKKKLIMSQEEMRAIVSGLEIPQGPMIDPMEQASADCLAICIQVLDMAPTEELITGIEETLLRQITTGRLSATKRKAIVTILQQVFTDRTEGRAERIWPMIWGPVRRSHPELMYRIWLEIWQGLASRGRERAWPFLVNDLLLGMPVTDRLKRFLLLEAVSQVEALGNHDIRVTLENLPALLEGTICKGFLDAPPPLLYPVHKVLVGCSISPRFGPLLHDSLVRQAPHSLSNVLLDIMDEYYPVNRGVYQAILDQGINEEVTPEMRELAPEIIAEALSDLHWDFMEEDWVVEAIIWLGGLGREPALPILDEIINEKKYMVLGSWPPAARQAAKAARDELRERLNYRGRREENSVAASRTAPPVASEPVENTETTVTR